MLSTNKCQDFLIALRIKPPSLSCKGLCDLAPAYLSTPHPFQTPLQTLFLFCHHLSRDSFLPGTPHLLFQPPRDSPSPLFAWTSLVAQLVKNPPAMQETWFDSWVGHDWATKHTAHNTYLAFKSQRVLLREVKVKSLSHIWLFATPWTVAHQAPPSVGFSRQECWSGLPFPPRMLCSNPAPSLMVSCCFSFSFGVLITVYNHAFGSVIPHQCWVSSRRWRTERVSPFLSVSPWGQSQCLGQTRQSRNTWRLTEWMTESCAEHRWARSVPLTDLRSLSPPLPQPGGWTRAQLWAAGAVSSSSQVPRPMGLAGCKAPEAKGRPCHPWEQEPPVGSGQSRWGAGPLGPHQLGVLPVLSPHCREPMPVELGLFCCMRC